MIANAIANHKLYASPPKESKEHSMEFAMRNRTGENGTDESMLTKKELHNSVKLNKRLSTFHPVASPDPAPVHAFVAARTNYKANVTNIIETLKAERLGNSLRRRQLYLGTNENPKVVK